MSSQNHNEEQNSEGKHEELNPAENPTPLELVHQQQAMQRQNLEVAQQRTEPEAEVPGAGIPSDRRHHPQRQMYGSGTDES